MGLILTNSKLSFPAEQGRLEEGQGSEIAYILRNMGLARNRLLREGDDVRASILRHAEEGETNPIFDKMTKVRIFQVCFIF
jgi:hypothetical protein